MTLQEKRELEFKELQERKEKERVELQEQLKEVLSLESIELLAITEREDSYSVKVAFTLDGYRQEDDFYWKADESQKDFILSAKKRIGYIKELREKYSDYCKQNDYIQTNSKFHKTISLTHMGYKREFYFDIQLADYMKLPNTTSCGFGGGDYEIKRTPKRLDEYNKNIDIAIDALLDCISELKRKKYVSKKEV
jgi:hypothetical protein